MRTQNRSRVAVSFLYADTDFFFSLLFFCSLLLFCFFGPKSQISSFSERQIQFFDSLVFFVFLPPKTFVWLFSFVCGQAFAGR